VDGAAFCEPACIQREVVHRKFVRPEKGITGQVLSQSFERAVLQAGDGDVRGEFPLFSGETAGNKLPLDLVPQLEQCVGWRKTHPEYAGCPSGWEMAYAPDGESKGRGPDLCEGLLDILGRSSFDFPDKAGGQMNLVLADRPSTRDPLPHGMEQEAKRAGDINGDKEADHRTGLVKWVSVFQLLQKQVLLIGHHFV
jgi:hypothetical protein